MLRLPLHLSRFTIEASRFHEILDGLLKSSVQCAD
jgi:hypothetical protein